MKTMTVFEARNHFARTLEAAKKDLIIVTRNGRPVAAIQGIDIERFLDHAQRHAVAWLRRAPADARHGDNTK